MPDGSLRSYTTATTNNNIFSDQSTNSFGNTFNAMDSQTKQSQDGCKQQLMGENLPTGWSLIKGRMCPPGSGSAIQSTSSTVSNNQNSQNTNKSNT